MTKKYIICPGWINSQNDDDQHFIGAHRLMKLYGVPPSECYTAKCTHLGKPGLQWTEWDFTFLPDNLPHLKPRYGGDYREYLESLEIREIEND